MIPIRCLNRGVTMYKISTIGQLINILKQWPRKTSLVIDIGPAIGLDEGDYQWHKFIAMTPTDGELEQMTKHTNEESTFTVLIVQPEAIGF